MVHDGQAAAEVLRLIHVVSGEDHRDPTMVDFFDQGPKVAACLGIQTGGGLVQNHQLRVVHQAGRDGEPLFLSP